jgi:hypothetical protein
MGAIAGSWAGLHGPGEKTIEKTGQSGSGLHKGLRVQEGPGVQGCGPAFKGGRPPGCGPTGRAARTQAGTKGSRKWAGDTEESPTSTAARWGCLGTRTPASGSLVQGARTQSNCQDPIPRKYPSHERSSGVNWNRFQLRFFFPKKNQCHPSLKEPGNSESPQFATSG